MINQKIPVIMDCDTGPDDAIAIALALASDKINVLGITTVAGNYEMSGILQNTRRTLALTDPTVPYAVGCDQPLVRKLDTHGIHDVFHTNMFAPVGDEGPAPAHMDAVEYMHDTIMASNEKVSLILLGPLTNIAHLFARYPEVKENIGDVVIMGGSVYSGNITKNAEFNIYVDPEAARDVFASGVHIVMFGLEACHGCLLTKDDAAQIRAMGGRTAEIYAQMIDDDVDRYYHHHMFPHACIYDAATLLWFEDKDAFFSREAYVYVPADPASPLDGCTFTEFRPEYWNGHTANTTVVVDSDPVGFKDMVIRLFEKYKED